MRPAVADTFPAFSAQYEGRTRFLYCDVRGLVTCGIGCLVDPISLALPLPWQNADGSPASAGAITDAWNTVKAATSLYKAGGGAFAPLTTIRLTDAAVDALLDQRASTDDRLLAGRFPWLRGHAPGYEDMPADVQLGLLSMCWAMGEGELSGFPLFCAAVRAGDWATAALQCEMYATGNPGLVPRNVANRTLFESAAAGGDPSVVSWVPASELPTQPDLAASP